MVLPLLSSPGKATPSNLGSVFGNAKSRTTTSSLIATAASTGAGLSSFVSPRSASVIPAALAFSRSSASGIELTDPDETRFVLSSEAREPAEPPRWTDGGREGGREEGRWGMMGLEMEGLEASEWRQLDEAASAGDISSSPLSRGRLSSVCWVGLVVLTVTSGFLPALAAAMRSSRLAGKPSPSSGGAKRDEEGVGNPAGSS